MTPTHSPLRKFRNFLRYPLLGLLTFATPLTQARADDAPANPPAAAPAVPLKPALPLDFADFAADYKPKAIYPAWLNVEVALMETTAAPLPGMATGMIPEDKWTQQMAVDFKPITMTCVIGAKTRFENVMVLEADKGGHPLGYSLPLGQVIYFLARDEEADGIRYSVHIYDAAEVNWVANPKTSGAFIPITQATVVSKDVVARANTYTYFLLSSRVAPSRPDVPVRPATLYKYLIVHIHRLDEPPAAQPSGLMVPPGGPAVSPGS